MNSLSQHHPLSRMIALYNSSDNVEGSGVDNINQGEDIIKDDVINNTQDDKTVHKDNEIDYKKIYEDITAHPEWETFSKNIEKDAHSKQLKRVLRTEAGVNSLSELKDLIKAGREAKGISEQEKKPQAVLQIEEENERLKSEIARIEQEKRQSELIKKAGDIYKELGGRTDNDVIQAEAVELMLYKGILYIDDEGEIATQSKLSVKGEIKNWLDSHPHYKAEQKPAIPGIRGHKSPINKRADSFDLAFDKFNGRM